MTVEKEINTQKITMNKNLHSLKPPIPNLDGIRALACIFVVISHMPTPFNFVTLGETGVGIFFTLSGFLMSYLYGTIDWNKKSVIQYGVARFSRIAPIYWLVITACILISTQSPNQDFPLEITGIKNIVRHYLFSGNVLIFWSIPLEVQYYIFFLFIWWGISNQNKKTYALPLIIAVCTAFLVTHAKWRGLELPNKIHFFISGTFAGVLAQGDWNGSKNRIALFFLQISSLLLLILPIWFYPTKPDFYNATELGISFATAIYFLSIPSFWTTTIFSSKIMRIIGRASFSIYLMHIIVFYFGAPILGISHSQYSTAWIFLALLGILIPIIISKYIEMPLQKKTRHHLEEILVKK